MYDTILDDDEMWEWMLKGWEKYSEKRELFCHYKRKEVADVTGGNSDEEEEEGGGRGGGGGGTGARPGWRGWIQGK